MTKAERKIAFKVEFSRILELLADQIYQSPLALLRENTQNAFDAIRMREAEAQPFEPSIAVQVDDELITVVDNGIGMTPEEIETHFWWAGRSGKNTDAARAAGVVGTFGIGALANFGVADELSVESQSAITGERTLSNVRRSELSTETEGISVMPIDPTELPGTIVRARLSAERKISLQEARAYLKEFVQFVDVPVWFNGEMLSGARHRDALPSERHKWAESLEGVSLPGIVSADLDLTGMASGELRVVLENIRTTMGVGRPGSIVLIQGQNAIRTLRSGFGLATVAVPSYYQWGGVIDLPFLKPTAGREALDASSNQLLQQIVASLDEIVSPLAAQHPESFSNGSVLQWIASTEQFHLCGPLEVTLRPARNVETLASAVQRSHLRYYGGNDQSVIDTYTSEDQPLLLLSRRSPRRACELGYLVTKNIEQVDTTPRVKEELPLGSQSIAHTALSTRITRVLEEDYFLAADIRYGALTGGLPLLVTDRETPVVLYLDAAYPGVATLLALYRDDFVSFGPLVKDFVRHSVFPRISHLVPSSTKEGAEAFLRHLRTNREWFEYELDDRADLEEILEEIRAGRLTLAAATRKLTDATTSVVEVTPGAQAPLSAVIGGMPEEPEDDSMSDPLAPRPSIDRRDEATSARILTSDASDLNGYTCFLSISDRVQREKGDFFLQPHSTAIVWGGGKVVFVFQHHSGQFGLYYDILCQSLVAETAGGGPTVTSTILTKDRTFIPIPDELSASFLPNPGETKRLEIRCDVLYLDEHKRPA